MMQQRPRNAAFTLMELLVAIVLTTLLLTLLSQIFNQTRRAISRGAATSEVIGNSRATSEQFLADLKQIIPFQDFERADSGSNIGGFMVIVQATRQVKFPPPQKRNVPESLWTDTQTIRSDQLVFFRNGRGVESLTPGAIDRFDSDARAPFVRVWYGHVSPPTGSPASPVAVEPGQSPMDVVTNLVLGRQAALLLRPTDTHPNGGAGGDIIATPPSPYAGQRIDLSPVSVLGGALWQGTTDAIEFDFPAAMSSDVVTPGFYHSNAKLWDPVDGQISPNYKQSALSWAFVENGRRLLATDQIQVPFTVEDVGRTHGVFIPYVSDFAIDFAADITDDYNKAANIWRWDSGWVNGSSEDTYPDGEPDVYFYDSNESRNGVPGLVTRRAIKWYTMANPNPAGANGLPLDPARQNEPITWAIPDPTNLNERWHSIPTAANWNQFPPYFDTPTLPDGSPAHLTSAVFVFGHTGPISDLTPEDQFHGAGKWWPYMIRIRYRLHNSQGDLSSVDPISGENISGRWFEQIIPIPR